MGVVALIPARGGSKGIKRKNIKQLNGKPLIAYTIEQAKRSKNVDRVIVSTDDDEIARISVKYGAEVPFMRPKELAKDDTPGIDPVIHCIKWLIENEKYSFEYICLLQCTSPFRNFKQIDEAITKLYNFNADSIVSICESEVTPYWMKKVDNDRISDFLTDNKFYARRQDIPKVYRLNGAIYISKVGNILKNRTWYTNNTLGYIMDRISSIDIDDIIDFKFAEFLMKEGY